MIKYEQLKRQLQEAQLDLEKENDQIEFERAAALLAAQTTGGLRRDLKEGMPPPTHLGEDDGVSSTKQVETGGIGGKGVGSSSSAGSPDNDDDGPAAAAVKKLEEELAAAADSSYTDMED